MFTQEHPIRPIFHFLPKVHKGCNPLTGRPIVAGIDSINERFGQWIDHQLQPLVVALLGYLRDTKHLLFKPKDFKWNNELRWVTCDVASLYSCIPHSLGLRAVSFFLSKHSSYSLTHQEFILQCLEYLLTHKRWLLPAKMQGLDGS